MAIKNDIMKELLIKRTRVSIKLSSIANDIAARGRRHDNSYNSDSEIDILIKIKESKDPEMVNRYTEMLKSIHGNNNDYCPEFHDNDLSKMDMIQLLEFIAHKINEYDELIVEYNLPVNVGDYAVYVLDGLTVDEQLKGVITNTINYVVDRNGSIIKNLPKSSEKIARETLSDTLQ